MTRRALTLAVLWLWLVPSSVFAQGAADEAEINFRLGTERYQQGDYRAALAHFLASNRLADNTNVKFNIARTFQRLAQFPEAYRWCVSALAGETTPELRALLEESLRSIEREVAVLDVASDPSGATIYLDRRDLGAITTTPATIAVPAGEHRLILERSGFASRVTEPIAIGKGERRQLTLSLARIVGKVEVVVPSGTEIRVDAESAALAGTGPSTLELAPGPHVLYFQKPGFRLNPRQLVVAAGELTMVRADAVPRLGSVLVTARQAGALIEIDGRPSGFTPAVIAVPVGKRLVRVSSRGYVPAERVITVEENTQSAWTDVDLTVLEEVSAAARLPQELRQAAASVSVIRREELAAFRYPTIAEALRGQRGVALSNDGAYTSLTLRGLGQPGDYGNRVLVLSDGATLNDDILWQSYIGYDGRVDLDDVERIELVRGPGSVLYGTGAVSGVVNLVPRAMKDTYSGEARITANDERTARGRVKGGMPVGTRGDLWLSVAGAHSAGERMSLPTSPEPTSVAHVGKFDAATIHGRFELADFTVQTFFTTRAQSLPNGAYGARLGDPRNDVNDTRALVEARYEPELGPRSKLYSRIFGNFYGFRSTLVYDREGEAAGPARSQNNDDVLRERYRGEWFGAEARFVVQAAPSLSLTAGSEVQINTEASLHGSVDEVDAEQSYLSANEPYQIYAAYALCEWKPVRVVSLSAGGRVDAWSTFGATFNPRANLVLRVSERDTIKLIGGRAFRAPSIYELRYADGGRTQVASDFEGATLRPEVVWSTEAEATHTFDGGFSGLVSVHGQHATHLIEQAPVTPANADSVVYYRNGERDLTVIGGDLELRRELRAGWMLAATYGALWARFEHAQGYKDTSPSVPNHYASARTLFALDDELTLALRGTLEAPRELGTVPGDTEWAVITDVVLSGVKNGIGLDYALGVYNLFDFSYALPTDPTFVTATMPQLGRTLLLSLGISR